MIIFALLARLGRCRLEYNARLTKKHSRDELGDTSTPLIPPKTAGAFELDPERLVSKSTLVDAAGVYP